MGLFRRINDIVSANLNDMIDKFEDPEKMLRQAVREMETSIAKTRQEVVQAMTNEKLATRNLVDNERKAQEWEHWTVKAVQAGDDALAYKALARKQEHEQVLQTLRQQQAEAAAASELLRGLLQAMQAKLEEARRALGSLMARRKAAEVRAKLQRGVAQVQMGADAFAKFEKLRAKVERAEAEADVLQELQGVLLPSPEALPAPPPNQLALSLELEELKKKLSQ